MLVQRISSAKQDSEREGMGRIGIIEKGVGEDRLLVASLRKGIGKRRIELESHRKGLEREGMVYESYRSD